MKYDVVIVGSGLGGLLCGYILSKNGFKVAILEKHHQPGGCLQTFTRRGSTFDTGMHYIGGVEEGQELNILLKYFDLFNKINLHKLDENGFDRIVLKDREFRFAMGYENFIETLAVDFPNERQALKKYVETLKNVADYSFINTMDNNASTKMFPPEYVTTSVGDFLASVTTNELLQNVLAGNNPLYAGIRDSTSMYVHALISNTYITSAYRIVDGSDSITNNLINSIRKFGGEIFLESEVTRFIVGDHKMVAVEINGKDILEASQFISAIHPQATLLRIDDTPLIRKAFRNRITQLKNTISSFTVYIRFKKNVFNYKNYNVYYYSSENVWNSMNYNDFDWPVSFLIMYQAKTPVNEYADSAVVLSYMNYADVQQWANTKVGKRGEDYLAFKKKKAEKLLEMLERAFPGINNSIESYYTSTPLTYYDYTGTTEGSMYGIQRDCNISSQLLVTQKTKIPNLFFTGQNINAHGMLGVAVGAIITASELLGMKFLVTQIKDSV